MAWGLMQNRDNLSFIYSKYILYSAATTELTASSSRRKITGRDSNLDIGSGEEAGRGRKGHTRQKETETDLSTSYSIGSELV
jgi:hypothetical protein